jgi:expansin (peptidoglycan-binding protein)
MFLMHSFPYFFFDTGGGASVTITVVDRCVGCAMTDLDFSPTAFDALTGGNRGLGRVKITWEWA